MSMSDDPRGFRRGQAGNRDYPPSQQGRGGQPPAPTQNRYDRFPQQQQPAGQGGRQDRQRDKPQPSFSAYRPEAFAKSEPRGSSGAQNNWNDTSRSAPRGSPSEPFPRIPQPPQDPYYNNSSADPYAGSSGGYEADWQRDPYNNGNAQQFPAYYPSHDDSPTSGTLQSDHDRFFAPEPEDDRAPPFSGFDDRGFAPPDQPSYGPQSAGFSEQSQRHHGVHTLSSNIGFDEPHSGGGDSEWDSFEPQPPAPSSVRPFHPPATIPDDDLDADFFGDEDEFDGDDYDGRSRGGRKRLMAAVLLGAIVAGGGLAYVYKKGNNNDVASNAPSLIPADERPVKAQPAEPGGREFSNGNKLIYDRLRAEAGDGSAPDAAAPPKLASASPSASNGTLEQRIENALKAQKTDDTSSAASGSSDAPRAVRTFTFGPDGSQKPVASKTQRPASTAVDNSISSGIVISTEPTAAPTRDITPAPSQQDSGDQQPRQQRLALSPRQEAFQTSETASGAGSYFIQAGARNDQAAAVAAFGPMQQKYASLLGNYKPSVRKVDLGDKGVWYRLLIGPFDNKNDADQLCERLKTAGMKGCFTRKD